MSHPRSWAVLAGLLFVGCLKPHPPNGAVLCAPSNACPDGYHCVLGACYVEGQGPLLPLGAMCRASSDCESNHCVDSVCCNRACEGQCEACNVESNEGTCSTISGVPGGTRQPCTGAGTTCGGTCDGIVAGSCTY